MPDAPHTIVETEAYLADARKALTDSERAGIVDQIARDPTSGKLVYGGGIRKLRVPVAGRGKRGGARVIYFYHDEGLPIFLLAFFAKNERDDLSVKEAAALVELVKRIPMAYGR